MVHNDYLIPGGETLTVHEQAAALRRRGFEVSVLEVDNSRWVGSTGPRALSRLVFDPRAGTTVANAIRESRADLVHTHNLFPSLGSAAMGSIAAAKIPWVQHLHNYRSSCISANHFRDGADCHRCTRAATGLSGIAHGCYQGSRGHSAGVAVFDLSRRTALARGHYPTLHVAVSERMRTVTLQLTPGLGQVEVLYNSFDEDASARVLAEPRAREGVIFVGRFTVEKGCLLAMDALDRIPGTPVTFIGDGPLRGDIERWAAHRTNAVVVGQAEPAEVLVRMAGAKVALALPLWEEPFGRTAVEAISVGTPVISTSRGALPELVSSAVGSVLAAHPTADAVASALARRLAVPSQSLTEGAAQMYDYAYARFSTASMVAGLAEIYDRASALHGLAS